MVYVSRGRFRAMLQHITTQHVQTECVLAVGTCALHSLTLEWTVHSHTRLILVYSIDSLQAGQCGGSSPGRGRDFTHSSVSALGPTKPPVHCEQGLFPKGKAAGAWRWLPIYT